LQKNLKTQRPSVLFTCFCLYVLCIDLLKGGKLENIDYSILVVLISFFFVSKDGHEESSYILSFIMVSLIICLYFFTYGQSGAVEVSEDGRTAWKDSNYLGNVCGMGIVLAYNVLVNNLYTNKKFKYLCLLTVIVGVMMIVLNASRGAFLSMTVAITIITLFARIKTISKFGIVIAVSLSVVAMYSLGLFEVLEERVMSDDGTGNARTIIWAAKLDAYSHLSLLEKVFGSGYRKGFELAIPGGFGFHCDYIAWLVDYGIVGLLFFISLLIYPLKLVWNRQSQRPIVLSLILFLVTCCSTLEPLTAGRLAYWYFYMLIVLFARWSSQQAN
jgi:membrane protein